MKSAVLIILSLVLFSAAPLAASAQEDLFDTKTAVEHLDKGVAHLKAKEYDAAIAEFEEAASIYPEAEAFYYLGYAYYMKGKAGDSESRRLSMENFDKAYEIDPNFTPTRYRPAEPVPALRPTIREETVLTPAAPSPETPAPETQPQEQPASPVPEEPAKPAEPQK
jgi:tetratricopeptide (TPR) repeat protein